MAKFDELPLEECDNCESNLGKIFITGILPNPPHADTTEWIEITNTSSETLKLDGCQVSDETRSYDLRGTLGS